MSDSSAERDKYLDIKRHRRNSNYSNGIMFRRVAWGLVKPFVMVMPRFFYELRNIILRLFGAKIGCSVRIYNNVDIFFPWNLEVEDEVTIAADVTIYSLGNIRIGSGCLISSGVHICAGSHDYTKSNLPLTTLPICIGEGVWVCADAFIGPGVNVGDFSIIGARGVVVKSIPEKVIVAGNPARIIKNRPMGI